MGKGRTQSPEKDVWIDGTGVIVEEIVNLENQGVGHRKVESKRGWVGGYVW